MVGMDTEAVIRLAVVIGMPLVGALIWFIRLEGRVNAHEASCEERQKKLDERYREANRRLDSIDGKLDRLLEHDHN